MGIEESEPDFCARYYFHCVSSSGFWLLLVNDKKKKDTVFYQTYTLREQTIAEIKVLAQKYKCKSFYTNDAQVATAVIIDEHIFNRVERIDNTIGRANTNKKISGGFIPPRVRVTRYGSVVS